MPTIFRFVSLLLRRRQSEKAVDRVLTWFGRWKKEQEQLPDYGVAGKKLLLVRLDDIGDYLLFRNSFALYKKSARWGGHEIVLLGNSAWKELFVALDREKADRVIWVDKEAFRRDASYRLALWTEVRKEGFGTVICPSRTRPLMLDDLFVLATGAEQRIATVNTFIHPEWNQLSDSLYTDLFGGDDPLLHEFYFNMRFAGWCCGEAAIGAPEARLPDASLLGQSPEIVYPFERKMTEPYILCFIGSSTKSKRWPVKRWIEFMRLVGEGGSFARLIVFTEPRLKGVRSIRPPSPSAQLNTARSTPRSRFIANTPTGLRKSCNCLIASVVMSGTRPTRQRPSLSRSAEATAVGKSPQPAYAPTSGGLRPLNRDVASVVGVEQLPQGPRLASTGCSAALAPTFPSRICVRRTSASVCASLLLAMCRPSASRSRL